MGGAKRQLEQGYRSNVGKTVCTSCFGDIGLVQFIERHNSADCCSYCDSSDEPVVACSLDNVLEHILSCVKLEWGHPANEGLSYESREGGWQGDVYTFYDLFFQIGFDCNTEELESDICNSILDQEWCRCNPYSLTKDQTLVYGWQSFCTFVMRKARYVFFRAKNHEYDEFQHDEMNPVNILESLVEIIQKLDLVTVISEDIEINRVRIVDVQIELTSAEDIGSPPWEKTTFANRMSPVGIPMFYGAFDVQTAIHETYIDDGSLKKAICGVFKPLRELNIVDLSVVPETPSLFDEQQNYFRAEIKFLNEFLSDFIKPIDRTDKAHIEYVPTQIVTEYIRHMFKTNDGKSIDGIIYPSSRHNHGKAIVIFAESWQCVDNNENTKEGEMLRLVGIESHML